ncbi:MAG: hypothetical protein JJE04_23210, partial [Acidobacteriia bacterium]|nr:hypothetical protein [Terriglobia bacterium]
VTASGENIWGTADAFQFVWKKVSGDVSLTAEVAFLTATGDPHKKAVLMLRESLEVCQLFNYPHKRFQPLRIPEDPRHQAPAHFVGAG